MDRDIKMTWSNPTKPMHDLSNGDGDWFQYANPEAIMEVVFGHPFVRGVIAFFQVLGGISGACFLVKYLKKAKPCVPKIDINVKAQTSRSRKDRYQWDRALAGEDTEILNNRKVEKKMNRAEDKHVRTRDEIPPPYWQLGAEIPHF